MGLTGLVVAVGGTVTYKGHVRRILRMMPAVASSIARAGGDTSNRLRIRFSRISVGCTGGTRSSLASVGLGIGGKRAVKVVNKANSNGDSIIGLVPHFCSMSRKDVGITKASIQRCPLTSLQRHVNIIVRGTMLFRKAVTRGLH